MVTNGDTWADSASHLSGVHGVDTVKVWHYAGDGRTYHNIKMQVSTDRSSWYTVFDSAVSGEYAETAAGRTYTFASRSVRYVRDYLNGSTSNSGNHWVEIEVWGACDAGAGGAAVRGQRHHGRGDQLLLCGQHASCPAARQYAILPARRPPFDFAQGKLWATPL